MPVLTENELKKQIKEKAFTRLYFLYGSEKYLIKHYVSQIIAKLLGKGYSDFNFQNFSSAEDIDAIAEAVEALPIMAEKKCVVVHDLNVESMSAQSLSKLYELLEDLPESTVLIISQSTLEIEAKRSAKWKKFLTAAQKLGVTAEFTKRSNTALQKQLCAWAQKRGCVLNPADAGLMVQLCGDDLLTLGGELEKLCAFAEGREITKKDIEAVVTKNMETTVFLLAKALVAEEYDKAYQQLDLLFYQKEEPVAVLAVLTSSFVDLYRVKAALESGEELSALSKDFDYKGKEFRIRNAERDGRYLTIQQLREILTLLLSADVRLKSSRVDKRIILEELIAQLRLTSERRRSF